jgi:hypothetical protein
MSKNITDNNLVTDAKTSARFWEEHPKIELQETTCSAFKKTQTAYQEAVDAVVEKENELSSKLAERDALASEVRLVVTRLRSMVKGFYGPDSKEYEQLGGTRVSDRKRPVRQATVASAIADSGSGTES